MTHPNRAARSIAAYTAAALAAIAVATAPTAHAAADTTPAPAYAPSKQFDPAADKNNDGNPDCLTSEEFKKLKTGQRLGKVATLIGSRGAIDHGDIGYQVRRWTGCEPAGNHYVPVCMGFTRVEKPDTKPYYKLTDKPSAEQDVDCMGDYPVD